MSTVFTRWFGVAVVAHVVGNWSQPDFPHPVGITNLLVGLLGLALVYRPGRMLLVAVASLTVVSVILEMPFTGNHWVVAGLAGLGIVLNGGRFETFAPALRVMFLVFYGFAAFSKLNSAFFDPSVSCAVFYANQSLDGLGLGPISSSSVMAAPLVWFTALVELSIVPLLVIERTRRWGVLIAAAFHILISFDLNQHFYDFTAVILALLVLFLPPVAQGPTYKPSRIRRATWTVLGGLTAMLVVLAVLPSNASSDYLLQILPFVVWLPLSGLWLRMSMGQSHTSYSVSFRPASAAAIVVVIALLNGLSPYFELKTAYSFNMYSNLVTAQGRTNHFVIPQTLPLRDGYENPIEVLSTADPGLDLYRRYEYALPLPELERYAAGSRVQLLALQSGAQVELSGLDLEAPKWWEVWLPLRSLDLRQPARCQNEFLPAL